MGVSRFLDSGSRKSPPVHAGFSSPPRCVSFPLPLVPLSPSSLVSTIWELSVSLALGPQGQRQTQASSMFIWGSARTRPRGEAAPCKYMLPLCTPPRREQITHLLLLGHVNGNCPVLPQGLSLSLLRTSTLRSGFTQAVMVAMPNLVKFGCVDTQLLFAHCPCGLLQSSAAPSGAIRYIHGRQSS